MDFEKTLILSIIGVVIGFVMGLTGAGGALIAIPLFMQFQGMSLKQASVYSLLAVIIASLSNFYHQRKNAQISLASLFVVFSSLGSYITQPYKSMISDKWIAMTLALIALYSLYSVWAKKEITREYQGEKSLKSQVPKTMIIGLTLGALTTFTGLGGGVLMLPILLSLYKLPEGRAVATSLVVVGLSSLSSFLIQVSKGVSFALSTDFVGLIISIIITSYLLKILISNISAQNANHLRRWVFTIVVIIALMKLF